MTKNTPAQAWDAKGYARNARFVAELGAPLVQILDPLPGERILDLGCGDGALTESLIATGATVVGADSSPNLIAAAQARGIDARLMDGTELTFENEFDGVFSNAALHWMRPPAAVVAGVARALVPGGRFVGEFGGMGNVDRLRRALHQALARHGLDPAARDPWYFPSVPAYRELMESFGFKIQSMKLIDRPTPLPGDITGWLETFSGAFVGDLDPALRALILTEVRTATKEALCDASGQWTADYVRLRFAAVKTPE